MKIPPNCLKPFFYSQQDEGSIVFIFFFCRKIKLPSAEKWPAGGSYDSYKYSKARNKSFKLNRKKKKTLLLKVNFIDLQH